MRSRARTPALRGVRRLPLGVGLALSWWSRQAGAQAPEDTRCLDGQLHVDGGFDVTWAEAIERACASLEKLTDRDRAAKVELRPLAGGAGANVSLLLGDGRTAERVASSPAELADVLEALFALPPTTPTAPDMAAPPPVAAKPPPPAAPTLRATADTSATPPAKNEPERPRIDVEMVGTARLSGAPVTLGLGLVVAADLDIAHGWLVGVRGRVDPLLVDVERHAEAEGLELGGGIELGRRLDVGPVAVDVGLGADGIAEVPFDGGRRSGGRREARGDVRPRVFGKLWVPARGFAFMGQLGLEVSPSHLADDRTERPGVGGELGAGVAWGGL